MTDQTATATSTEPASADEVVELSTLIVGAGAAGARTAIELAQQGVDTDEFLVIGKRDHGDAHTTWARGGINGALGTHDPEDDWAIHAADTIDEGHSLNDPTKVETVTREMPERLRELDDWGMDFSRTSDGEIDQRYFGAQSFRRTAFAGDHTGESIMTTLVDRAQELGIAYRENVMVTQLLVDDGRILGAAAYDMADGHLILFEAETVVLAAGGYTSVYGRHSSRDDENTGDGPALAYEAGARLMDMEFVQFHPTGMAVDEGDPEWAPWAGRLVTEAVRGEGGRLYNAEGERFMERYSPDQMELDARDVVARAIAKEVEQGRGTDNGGVYLDISHRDRAFIRERLPRMFARFDELGVDLATDRVEVAPTAHYGMGGVLVDDAGETDVDGLYAIGETMAGVHGANRLGGNSLAETVAYGRVTGAAIADRIERGSLPERDRETLRNRAETQFADLVALTDRAGEHEPRAVLDEIRDCLETSAGIIRDEDGLAAGLDRLATLREKAGSMAVGDRTSRSFEYALDVGFALTVAEAVLRGARERTESRGAHFRRDYPETRESWERNVVYARDEVGAMRLEHDPVDTPGERIQRALDAGYELDYHQLE